MPETIGQRQLRNDNADIVRRVEAGETFVVTRNGHPIADLTPHGGGASRRGFTLKEQQEYFATLPPIDVEQWYRDLTPTTCCSGTTGSSTDGGRRVARHLGTDRCRARRSRYVGRGGLRRGCDERGGARVRARRRLRPGGVGGPRYAAAPARPPARWHGRTGPRNRTPDQGVTSTFSASRSFMAR